MTAALIIDFSPLNSLGASLKFLLAISYGRVHIRALRKINTRFELA
ncbi:Unknown protein sequence [Pseudomonas coronafaciens pv. oryzae]|nr:Unknown protein sequence [Pseudomonas coronafaciens pv. oryzae]